MKITRIFACLLLAATSVAPASAKEEASNQFDFVPSPAIWKLADEDTTIYLFGTIHLLPSDLKWRTEKFDAIVKEVDELVVETSDTDFESLDDNEEIFSSMMDDQDVIPLMERVAPENQQALTEMAKYVGLPLEVLDIMPAWIIPFMVYFKSIEGAEAAGEYGYEFGVETVLEAEFSKMEKPILSIEDPTAILEAMTNIPEAEQTTLINDMLKGWRAGEFGDSTNNITADADIRNKAKFTDPPKVTLDHSEDIAWAKGEIEKLEAGLTKEELGEGFYNVLITERNTAWTSWLENRLEKPGKILLAVGSGHFVGEDALLKMLAEKGLKVERLQ